MEETAVTMVKKRRIGQILLRAGLITQEQLKKGLDSCRGRRLGRTLVELGYVTETDIATTLAKELNLTYLDLAKYEINPKAVNLVSEEIASRYLVLPIDIEENKLMVAMFDPSDVFAIDDLRIASGREIKPVISTETDLITGISNYYCLGKQVQEAVGKASEEVGVPFVSPTFEREKEEKKETLPVKMVNSILIEGVRRYVNDIHVEPQEDGLRIRYRIDGVLQEVTHSSRKIQAGVISRLKIMAGMDISERRLPQDGRFEMKVNGKTTDFRVATLPTVYGEKVVVRLLEKSGIMMSLDDLGFLSESLRKFRESLERPYGAILVTGPTGSGKTTTLYGALNRLNVSEKNIITVEDPVEYRLAGINQVHINPRAGLTFASGLRSILRNDPDIVMIGEIRDKETAQIAIESALTGHLVLSTLHTNDAPSSLIRLAEMGIEPFLVASAVDCIVAQRLARKLCSRCKQAYTPSLELLKKEGFSVKNNKIPILYKAVGCKRCNQTGFKGRIGLFEVLRMSEKIKEAIIKMKTSEDIKKIAKSEGMSSLKEDGFEKVLAGLTSVEEILRVTT